MLALNLGSWRKSCSPLLDRHGLGEIPWLVDVPAQYQPQRASEVLEALTDWGETRLAVRRGEW